MAFAEYYPTNSTKYAVCSFFFIYLQKHIHYIIIINLTCIQTTSNNY